MSPDKISFFDLISKSKPRSSWNKPTYHTWVISLSNICLQAMLILLRNFYYALICIIYFPNQIAIVVCLKGNIKFFICSSNWAYLCLLSLFNYFLFILVLFKEVHNCFSFDLICIIILLGLESFLWNLKLWVVILPRRKCLYL